MKFALVLLFSASVVLAVANAADSCPKSCTKDTECAKCTGKTSCDTTKKVCGKAAASCPKSCTKNADCAKCTYGAVNCINKKCQKTCPTWCKSNADCVQCDDGPTCGSTGCYDPWAE